MIPLPAQPHDVGWPTLAWSTGPLLSGSSDRLDDVLDQAFAVNPNADLALSLAFVAVQGGRIVAERYGPTSEAHTRLISWSTAKSVTQAALGIAVRDGLIDLDAVPVAPEWADPADPRHDITLSDLLAMRSGLEFNEDYVDATGSHCLEMLFGAANHDMASYAASQGLIHPRGTVWNYSSGTTNIISRRIGTAVAGQDPSEGARRDAMERFLRDELFNPLGMWSAEPRYDDVGTFVGSSYLYATARDLAKFGYLYLRDGRWEDRQLIPSEWVLRARTERSQDPDEPFLGYSEQWWTWHDDHQTFAAQGYEGQLIAIVPDLDLVLVRLGKTPIAHRPALFRFYRDVIDAISD